MASNLSRRNSVKEGAGSRAGSRRGSTDSDVGIFGQQKTLKKGKPVSSVKITFMGKNMVNFNQNNKCHYVVIFQELLVPMNDDLNII